MRKSLNIAPDKDFDTEVADDDHFEKLLPKELEHLKQLVLVVQNYHHNKKIFHSVERGHRGHTMGPLWYVIYFLCIQDIVDVHQIQENHHFEHGATCRCKASSKGGHKG